MSTTDDPSDSLIAALSKARIPLDNHKYIQRLMGAIGIREYRAMPKSDKPYVVAVREDDLPDLRIFSGYTIGFTTEEEAHRIGFGSDTIRASDDAGKVWLVSHPVHGDLDKRGPADLTKRRDPGRCPECGIWELSISGNCPSCDEY